MEVIIYAVLDPDTQEIRYIGKTVRTMNLRLAEHIREAKRGNDLWFFRWLRNLDKKPIIKELERISEGKDWQSIEMKWIDYYKKVGAKLTNATNGGEGLHGYKFSESHKQKISDSHKRGTIFCCHSCGDSFWRSPSEITNGHNKFCSKQCYFSFQVGKKKNYISPNYGRAGREAAANKKRLQTHCKRRHPLSGENLYISTSGSRVCKECRKIHKRNHRKVHGNRVD